MTGSQWLGVTEFHKWRPTVWRMGALPKMDEEIVSGSVRSFRICPFLCGCLWWKLLIVYFKILIYCGQLCNNAVDYPRTPLNWSHHAPNKTDRTCTIYCTLGCVPSFQNVTLRSSWLKCYVRSRLTTKWYASVMKDQILFCMWCIMSSRLHFRSLSKCDVERTALSRVYIMWRTGCLLYELSILNITDLYIENTVIYLILVIGLKQCFTILNSLICQ
jgi:hypothetical protein